MPDLAQHRAPEAGGERSIPSPSLHTCMVGLVLLNLVFVQLTEAASLAWLLPLYVLTLSSSFFARYKERTLYRALWNVGVLGFFALLVSHAMSADLAYVLQDGLTLAVLCQVHLLNNLHRNQRPDLLFLNSYLIAIITGYITVDLGFAGAFLGYVPFYILGLQFLSVFRADAALDPREVRAIAFDGARRSVVLLGLALLAFAFWPRDFQREALLSRYFEFSPSNGPAKVDFSESLDLKKRKGQQGKVDLGRVVMTIQPVGPSLGWLPDLWRGATLGKHLPSGSWSKGDEAVAGHHVADAPWSQGSKGMSVVRKAAAKDSGGPTGQRVRVTRAGDSGRVAFMPYGTTYVELAPVHREGELQWSADGVLRYSNPGELRYELTLGEPDATLEGDVPPRFDALLQLEDSVHTETASKLAEQLSRRLGSGATDADLAMACMDLIRKRSPYRSPVSSDEDEVAVSLAEFLTTEKGGHCEFFASALATMLRSQGVPSRVVTGFRLGPPDLERGLWEVRSTYAHAWVEAYADGRWQTFDPTPAMDLDGAGASWIERAKGAMTEIWARVTTFDAESRAALYAWMRAAPGRFLSFCRDHPASSLLVGALLVVLAVYRRRLRLARTPASVRALIAAYRSAKVAPAEGETPRETLIRAEQLPDIDVESVAGLRRAVQEHEAERYA